LNQIFLLLRLYVTPGKAVSRILDEGRLIVAALGAIAVLLALQVPRAADYEREQNKALMRLIQARTEKAVEITREKGAQQGKEAMHEVLAETYADMMSSLHGPPTLQRLVGQFTAESPAHYFSPLIALAICFVPAAILVLVRFEPLGSFSMVLQRDYAPLLACCLFSWTASYLLLLGVNSGLRVLHSPAYNHPALWSAAQAYFLVLTAISIRMVFRTRIASAFGAAGGAFVGAVGGIWLYGVIGNPLMYVASPCLLYYLYGRIAPGVTSMGSGLSNRQRLKQGLENATVNPCDFDAHYQLGLIYLERRQYEKAIQCFRKSVEVGPNEPDAHYQLGRIAREQGRYREAIDCCRAAARLYDKHSSSEVWREIGIASLLDGDTAVAREALEKYLERRPYDPEALCWYGRTLVKLGQLDDARAAFGQAIEAVQTMPPGRQRQLRAWASEAARELRKLVASMKATV